MSGGYYYPASAPPDEDEDFDLTSIPFPMQGSHPQQVYHNYSGQPIAPSLPQRQLYHEPQQLYQPPQQHYPQQYGYPLNQAQNWMTPTGPSNYPYEPHTMAPSPFPRYSEPLTASPEMTAGPSRTSTGYLSPDEAEKGRVSRSMSFAIPFLPLRWLSTSHGGWIL